MISTFLLWIIFSKSPEPISFLVNLEISSSVALIIMSVRALLIAIISLFAILTFPEILWAEITSEHKTAIIFLNISSVAFPDNIQINLQFSIMPDWLPAMKNPVMRNYPCAFFELCKFLLKPVICLLP